MANTMTYAYIDEESIDPELICIICGSPFDDPVCTSCNHTFCRQCITEWVNAGYTKCVMCPQQLVSIENLTQASLSMRKMLDRLSVRCIFCGNLSLQRGDFDEHIRKTCPKVQICCPSADINCPWKGPRDQLDNHVTRCIFEHFRSLLSELIGENQQLLEQMKRQRARSDQQELQIYQLSDRLSKINRRLNDGQSLWQKKPCDNCRGCLYLTGIADHKSGYYHVHYNNSNVIYRRSGVGCSCNCHYE